MLTIESKDLTRLLESIKAVYGYDFTNYAEASVKRRIIHFMNSKKIPVIQDLTKVLLQDEKNFEEFICNLSVTVTEMFRDPAFYKSLRDKVVKRLATYPFIKVWVAGCATGEEVYSLAILLQEENMLNRTVIYATDINQNSLQIAKSGIFPLNYMKDYTANYINSGGRNSFSDYYMAKYDSILFDKTLRQNIVFASHNLATDNSFNEFQLILCRNVLIYFNQQLQNKVIDLFYNSLCPFGYLGLGNKESLLFSDKKKHFSDLDRKEKIFMKS